MMMIRLTPSQEISLVNQERQVGDQTAAAASGHTANNGSVSAESLCALQCINNL
jgi:hypothetical protein